MLCTRPICEPQRLEDCYRLRYESYLENDHVKPNSKGVFIDEFDDPKASINFGAFYNDDLVGTVRFNLPPLPSTDLFPEITEIMRQQSPAEMTRMCVAPAIKSEVKRFRIFTALARETIITCLAGDIDMALVSVKTNLSWFYEKVCGFETIAGPRYWPRYNATLKLMGVDVKKAYSEYSFTRRSILGISAEEIEARRSNLLLLEHSYEPNVLEPIAQRR
jgi:hypothetical protein